MMRTSPSPRSPREPSAKTRMNIALLDDDRRQAELIGQVLAADGHLCAAHDHGQDLLAHLRRAPDDMLIIAWQVADRSGAEVLHWIREKLAPGFPVLLLASTAHPEDIDAALAAGVDDYQVLPLRRAELRTRVQALLRRAYPQQAPRPWITFGRYAFETHDGKLSRDGHAIDVTRKEFDLALLLFQHLGRPLSRATILEAVWGHESDIPSRTMDTHVSRVRTKLALRPENGFRLAPVYSYGYCLERIGA